MYTQAASSSSREEEFHSAFQRAKEQTEAREQYFADLRRKCDEMQKNVSCAGRMYS